METFEIHLVRKSVNGKTEVKKNDTYGQSNN